MNKIDILQIITNTLFLVIFAVTTLRAIRQPRRATVNIALLFGTAAIIVLYTIVAPTLSWQNQPVAIAIILSLLMALGYLLLRLVEDFTNVPRTLSVLSVATLGLLILYSFTVPITANRFVIIPYIVYFFGLALYSSVAFVRTARQASGVTRRRLQAVAAGSLLFGLDMVIVGLRSLFPALSDLWILLSHLFGIAIGIGYFIGFAPPPWLRRAWQEPELRAFLGRAARLPRLPTTSAIIAELESGAAAALGAPAAVVFAWDNDAEVLRIAGSGTPFTIKPGQMIAGRSFAAQQSLFVANAPREDPEYAETYRSSHATTILAAPITAGDARLGVLCIYAPRPSIFAEDDLVLVQLLADQAAVILESRSLIDEAARVQAREEATRLKDDFLSAAAHDLKTPLTGLLGHAQVLERRAARDPDAPTDREGLQRIITEALRLKRLVLDLLDASRIEQGKLVGQREPADLVALAGEAVTHIHSPLHDCGVEAPTAVPLHCDVARVMQLLDNLLENAVKYSPDGGPINIRVWSEGEEAHLTVTDTGIGIPAADLPHLFERFHRANNVDDRSFTGMGLGLYICHAIAEQHGGHLWATSEGAGRGSVFHLVLPVEDTNNTTDATGINLAAE